MITKGQLAERMEAYLEKYPPDKGYTRKVVDALTKAKLKIGDNLGVLLALQYDGKETDQDYITFAEGEETRSPYVASYSLDVGGDCADFCRNIDLLLFANKVGDKWTFKNIGNWTEGIWQNYHTHEVPWSERRPMDIVLYKFSDRNPHATHAALYIGGGFILHTTSKSNPLRVQADTYGASGRVGVFRVLTDDEYNSLIVDASWNDGTVDDNITEEGDIMLQKGDKGEAVYLFQCECVKAGYVVLQSGKTWLDFVDKKTNNGCDGSFGDFMVSVTKQVQAKHGLDQTGTVDALTYGKLTSEVKVSDAELEAKYKAQGEELATVQKTVTTLEASLTAVKTEVSKYV